MENNIKKTNKFLTITSIIFSLLSVVGFGYTSTMVYSFFNAYADLLAGKGDINSLGMGVSLVFYIIFASASLGIALISIILNIKAKKYQKNFNTIFLFINITFASLYIILFVVMRLIMNT